MNSSLSSFIRVLLSVALNVAHVIYLVVAAGVVVISAVIAGLAVVHSDIAMAVGRTEGRRVGGGQRGEEIEALCDWYVFFSLISLQKTLMPT